MRSSDSDIRAESCNTTPSPAAGGGGVVFYVEYFTENREIFSNTQPPSRKILILTLHSLSAIMWCNDGILCYDESSMRNLVKCLWRPDWVSNINKHLTQSARPRQQNLLSCKFSWFADWFCQKISITHRHQTPSSWSSDTLSLNVLQHEPPVKRSVKWKCLKILRILLLTPQTRTQAVWNIKDILNVKYLW